MNKYIKNLRSILMMGLLVSVTLLKSSQLEQNITAQPGTQDSLSVVHQAQSPSSLSSKCTNNHCVLGCLDCLKGLICIRIACKKTTNDETSVECECVPPRCPWNIQYGLSCCGCCCDECHHKGDSQYGGCHYCPLYCGSLGNKLSEKWFECRMSCKRKS